MPLAITCRVCSQPVKKHAVICAECNLIAHARCSSSAPATCVIRAHFLEIADYSPSPDSPEALERLGHPTPSGSPAPASVLASQHQAGTPTAEITPPTAFRMFNAFRRSRSSLLSDPDTNRKRKISLSATSGAGSSESVLASQATAHTSTAAPRRRSLERDR